VDGTVALSTNIVTNSRSLRPIEGAPAAVSIDPGRYPLLCSIQEATWDSTAMRFLFEPLPADPDLIGNVRCACFTGDRALVIDTAEFGPSGFPGGTLEPGEDWTHALDRELFEEAGARPVSVDVVGRIHFWSGFPAPYRPHLPHPEFHQVVSYAEIEMIGVPTNPPDGEHVLSVELLAIDEACERLRIANPFEAELLHLVAQIRQTSQPG
jgi:8-oxo-dGTP diphosphatase